VLLLAIGSSTGRIQTWPPVLRRQQNGLSAHLRQTSPCFIRRPVALSIGLRRFDSVDERRCLSRRELFDPGALG
jgi:hypothetical protein